MTTVREEGGSDGEDDEHHPPMTKEQVLEHNSVLVTTLEELARMHRVRGGSEDHWRGITFSKAANIIRAHPRAIRNRRDCKGIKGLGAKCVDKIEEIITTGSLNRLQVMSKDPKIVTLDLFQTVHDIGPKRAAGFWDQGMRTLDDLRRCPELTTQQTIYLRYYDELMTPIVRAEVQEVEKYLVGQTKA